MIAAFDPVQCRIGANFADYSLQQSLFCKAILCSADEEHWNVQTVQVLVAKLILFAGRMKWIAQKDQAADFREVGRNVGGDSPAHGLSADDEPF